MADKLDKNQALDAARIIKKYCREGDGCQQCIFYARGDCTLITIEPCDWELSTLKWTAQEKRIAYDLLNYDVDTVNFDNGRTTICKSTQNGTYINFHAVPKFFFPSIVKPGYYSLNKIAKGEDDNNA